VRKLAINGGEPLNTKTSSPLIVTALEKEAVRAVLNKGVLSSFRGGEFVRKFETEFAKYVGTEYALATTSGTTALHTSISSLNLNTTDEVLVPAVTFVSTASVVLQENLKVVFVDIDEYYGMDTEDLERKITKNSKAIIPVHLYGQPVNMDKIKIIAKKHNLKVIEDACQSHGAEFKGVKTGNLGDIGCFSFYETKNMTCGEGGMITTSDAKLYEQLCLRREHGSPRNSDTWYNYKLLGYNYNMTELQGSIGSVQLSKLDDMNEGRRINASLYDKYLSNLELELPKIRPDSKHVRHNYPVLLPKKLAQHRYFFVKAMASEGIPIDIAYPMPLYETVLFKNLGYVANCPRSDDITSRLFTLFTDTAISEEIIKKTSDAAKSILNYIHKSKVIE